MRFELEQALESAQTIAPDELPFLLGELEVIRTTALARLSGPPRAIPQPITPDVLLDVGKAASVLGVSKGYIYRHHAEEPFKSFVKPIGRKLLFSSQGIQNYLAGKRNRRA